MSACFFSSSLPDRQTWTGLDDTSWSKSEAEHCALGPTATMLGAPCARPKRLMRYQRRVRESSHPPRRKRRCHCVLKRVEGFLSKPSSFNQNSCHAAFKHHRECTRSVNSGSPLPASFVCLSASEEHRHQEPFRSIVVFPRGLHHTAAWINGNNVTNETSRPTPGSRPRMLRLFASLQPDRPCGCRPSCQALPGRRGDK